MALAAIAVAVATPAATSSASPLLGMVGDRGSLELAQIDPQTLQPGADRRIVVGSGGCASRSGGEACWTVPPWTFSPDRTFLAVARNSGADAPSLRIVDVARMGATASIPVPGGPVGELAWLTRTRVLALQERCCVEQQRLEVVDVARRRVVARRSLSGSVQEVASTANGLVLLLAPSQAIGRARLAVVAPSGALRVVALRQILAGVKVISSSPYSVRVRTPGLAVDSEGGRAFVVDAGLVGEIDLRSLAVSYHALGRSPAARAKLVSGPTRTARWLGGGILAVSGTDGDGASIRPFGLAFVDTRSWTVRAIDTGASGFALAGDVLLAMGPATGIAGYAFDGKKQFQLFDGETAWISQAYGGLAYVGIAGPNAAHEPLRVVDVTSGRVVGERADPLPWLLLGTAAGWWGAL